MPEDAVGEPGIADVLPGHIVELAAAVGRAHAVDLHHDETQLGDRLHVEVRREALGDKGAVWTGVDVLDDGVLATRIETGGADDDAPDVGGTVASLRGEDFRRAPPRFRQRAQVGALQFEEDLAVARLTQLCDRSEVHARPGIDVQLTVRRIRDQVVRRGIGQRRQAGAIEVDAVEMREVRILFRVHAAGAEVDLPLHRVHPLHRAHDELTPGDLVLHLAGGAVVQVQVRPPVTLRQPDDLGAVAGIGAVDPSATVERTGCATIIDEGG